VFNPETLLSVIIDKIKDYNQLASRKADSTNSGEEGIYIGLVQLTGKIIDNFDIRMCERIVEHKSLIDEIFVKFLFASVFSQSKETAQVTTKVVPKRLYGD
jgi:hypothetical protein